MTGETFLLSDIIGLAYKWNLPIRNRPAQGVLGGNGNNQITMVFKDLLNDLKAANQGITAFTLFGRLKDVKKFAHLSDELREVLFQESILYVEKSSKTIRDNRKEIARLTRQCQYNQDILAESSSERSLSPKEGHGIGQRSAESAEQMSKIKDWKSAFGFDSNSAPDSCCQSVSEGCGKNAIGGDTLWPEGCLAEFDDYIEGNIFLVGGVGIALILVQLIAVITGCCLAKKMGDGDNYV